MNEPINQIAEMCGFDATPENPYMQLSQGDLEYFARCLLRECMKICEHENYYDASILIKESFKL